jgi:hypothetical protein
MTFIVSHESVEFALKLFEAMAHQSQWELHFLHFSKSSSFEGIKNAMLSKEDDLEKCRSRSSKHQRCKGNRNKIKKKDFIVPAN